MNEYKTRQIDENTRVQWVYDEEYQTVGHYAYDTEEETKKAEDWELERIRDGRLVALGAIVQHRCAHCDQWRDGDSLWGIVVKGNDEELDSFATHDLDLSESA